MAQVSNQFEFLAALAAFDPNIQVTNSMFIAPQLTISYPVTVSGLKSPVILQKDNSYPGHLFYVQNGGSLTLKNIILETDWSPTLINTAECSPILVDNGSLRLLEGSVIRNGCREQENETFGLTHTLTYHGNEPGEERAQWVPYPISLSQCGAVTLSPAIPTLSRHSFTGWNTRVDGTGISYQPGETIPLAGLNIDLYAQWNIQFHTLTYVGNDCGISPVQQLPSAIQFQSGGGLALSSLIPERRGFYFLGWSFSPCGSTELYQPGQVISAPSGDALLYAQWKQYTPAATSWVSCSPSATVSATSSVPTSGIRLPILPNSTSLVISQLTARHQRQQEASSKSCPCRRRSCCRNSRRQK